MLIRTEQADDWAAVYDMNTSAFNTRAEADLVEVLREQARPVISA